MSDLRLKYTKFDFDAAPPQTPLGELTALFSPLARFQGSYQREMKGREGEGEKGGKRKEGRRGSRGRKEMDAPFQFLEYATGSLVHALAETGTVQLGYTC